VLVLGPIVFGAPWLLLGLAALPILWLLLRAVPPAPIRRRFPGVALLLGLRDDDAEADRTPWWLLLLRILAIAALVAGLARPVLNPEPRQAGSGPLLVLADGSWADARTWESRVERIGAVVAEAGRSGRPVAIATLTGPTATTPEFTTADVAALSLGGLHPNPWAPDFDATRTMIGGISGGFDTVWLSDGLDHGGRATLAEALARRGSVTVYQTPQPTFALRPARFEDAALVLTAVRTPLGAEQALTLAAIGPDPNGAEAQLATAAVTFGAGEGEAKVALSLPAELRNRVTRLELVGQRSAAAVTLADDSLRRREVAMISASGDREGLELLSPLHYLRKALEPAADILTGTIGDILLANPDVLILADVATTTDAESDALIKWVEAGGLLVRFAGPRLAALGTTVADDPLMPVRLRAGGRSVGGAMSWGDPKTLAPFSDTSPFAGLAIPADVTVSTQVMAQPDPSLAERVIAQLADGTPLVTRHALGDGQVVLFHVTANAEWSTLPLSGLFVQMLERLAVLGMRPLDAMTELEGTSWVPQATLDAFGHLTRVDTLPAVTGERLAEGALGPDLLPGLYGGTDRVIALNVFGDSTALAPARWPSGTAIIGLGAVQETPLGGWLLGAALLALLSDLLATMALSGRLLGPRSPMTGLLLAALLVPVPHDARAQDTSDAFALEATSNTVLAYVITGDQGVDEVSAAGLLGLSNTLYQRTSIEPARPMGVDIEHDELAYFPLIYWPIVASQPLPSREAYAKLNRYLRTGGMILFDTRDADTAGFGSATPEGQRLLSIARGLDIPPLEPIPSDHVLTRAFYLLQDFPGRYAGREVWVEAAPPEAAQADGMPFRNLNDGVTPVVIGGNDWAAAWAISDNGAPMFLVGRGSAGDRQREIAFRFGVNIVMHVLTGNYKSDQVHVPALLDRLGK